MYSCSDLKKGLKLLIDGDPHVIVQFDFTKPGKGQALYRCKLRNMITGALFDRTYRSGESFEPASLDERDMQYLYQDETGYVFMDQKTYEQVILSEETLGDDKYFLIDNMEVKILMRRLRRPAPDPNQHRSRDLLLDSRSWCNFPMILQPPLPIRSFFRPPNPKWKTTAISPVTVMTAIRGRFVIIFTISHWGR